MRTKHERGTCQPAAAFRPRALAAMDAERHVELSEHPEPASDPLSLAARAECRDAMREMPDHVMLPKCAVLELMERAFVRGATWRQEVASESCTHTAQGTLNAVRAFLDEHREVLAHAGDDCSDYHAIYSALTEGTATPEQARGFLLAEETQRRLNSSGAGVSRWGQLVLQLGALCQ